MAWKSGRGLLGPMQPLIGEWSSRAEEQEAQMKFPCSRSFTALGKGWIELHARWDMGDRGAYRERAMFGAGADGNLSFWSFTSDGKKSEGRLADAFDIDQRAIAFEAEMPAGLARMIYWPLRDDDGFNFAVESRTRKGWNRFLRQTYRPT